MATDKPRFSVSFSDESFRKIELYQKRSKINTRSKAVAQLVELALDEIKKTSYPDDGEDKLVESYRSMNKEGQEALLLYAENISSFEIYKKGRAPGLGTKEA